MKAEYVDNMGDDLSVVNAARVSFDKVSDWELKEIGGLKGRPDVYGLSEKDTRLINYLAKNNHWSPFAHQRFTFKSTDDSGMVTFPDDPTLTTGMVFNSKMSKVRHSFYGWVKLLESGHVNDYYYQSIVNHLCLAMPHSSDAFGIKFDKAFCSNVSLVINETDPIFIDVTLRMSAPLPIRTQCFKHKAGFTENEESRRYIQSTPEVFIPDVFRSAPEGSVKQGSGGKHPKSKDWLSAYKYQTEMAVEQYENMIADGICPEQARFILPQGCMVNWIWTGNLAGYARFYNQRTDPHAQEEVRDLAEMVGDIIAPLYPVSWGALT